MEETVANLKAVFKRALVLTFVVVAVLSSTVLIAQDAAEVVRSTASLHRH